MRCFCYPFCILTFVRMAEDLKINANDKAGRYKELIPQIKALTAHEPDSIANMGNVCAALKYTFSFFWVGFYLVKEDELVLSVFQGPVACTRIRKGKGVCGSAWERAEAIIVPDVDAFPGHIACSSLSKSEIVVPLFGEDGSVIGVLDVDSDRLAAFDETDAVYLKEIVGCIRIGNH